MKTGAYFCAIVPALPWLYSSIDEKLGHYRRYTKQKILKIQKTLNGASLSTCYYFNFIGALAWLFKYKLFKSTEMSNKDLKTIESILPLIKLLDKSPLPFGQSLFFALRKN